MISDRWIRDGIAQATRLKRDGLTHEAADVLAYIERRVVGQLVPYRPPFLLPFCEAPHCSVRTKTGRLCCLHRPRGPYGSRRPCAVRDCGSVAIVARRFCKRHRPRFDAGAVAIAARMRRVA